MVVNTYLNINLSKFKKFQQTPNSIWLTQILHFEFTNSILSCTTKFITFIRRSLLKIALTIFYSNNFIVLYSDLWAWTWENSYTFWHMSTLQGFHEVCPLETGIKVFLCEDPRLSANILVKVNSLYQIFRVKKSGETIRHTFLFTCNFMATFNVTT